MIASDHAPHGCVDKEAEFELAANGILGLQTTLPLILELVAAKKLGLNRAIDALSAAPAKLLGKTDIGTLKPGSHADLTLIDLNKTWKLAPENVVSKSTNSPFLGREFKTKVRMTLVGGKIKYDSEK
jgi:dihydroorotase